MRTPRTMFYFSCISHVRAALFFNMSETLKQLWNAKTIYFVLFQFYFMLCLGLLLCYRPTLSCSCWWGRWRILKCVTALSRSSDTLAISATWRLPLRTGTPLTDVSPESHLRTPHRYTTHHHVRIANRLHLFYSPVFCSFWESFLANVFRNYFSL